MNQIIDDTTPSIVINYKSRKEAEVAMLKGRTFQDRLLSITWVSGHHLHRGGSGNNMNSSVQLSVHSEQAQPTAEEEIDLEVCSSFFSFFIYFNTNCKSSWILIINQYYKLQ